MILTYTPHMILTYIPHICINTTRTFIHTTRTCIHTAHTCIHTTSTCIHTTRLHTHWTQDFDIHNTHNICRHGAPYFLETTENLQENNAWCFSRCIFSSGKIRCYKRIQTQWQMELFSKIMRIYTSTF